MISCPGIFLGKLIHTNIRAPANINKWVLKECTLLKMLPRWVLRWSWHQTADQTNTLLICKSVFLLLEMWGPIFQNWFDMFILGDILNMKIMHNNYIFLRFYYNCINCSDGSWAPRYNSNAFALIMTYNTYRRNWLHDLILNSGSSGDRFIVLS